VPHHGKKGTVLPAVHRIAMREKTVSLIRLQPVTEIVRTAIWTGRLTDEKPVSLILIASQESAKSAALLIYAKSPSVEVFSDLTSKGLETIKSKIESGEIRHLIALDLIRIVSHGRFVSDRTIQTLGGLMEEGEGCKADAGGTDVWRGMPNIGLLTGLTPDLYRSRRSFWRQTGFLTRFVPVNFHYSENTRYEIHQKISRGLLKPTEKPQILPKEPIAVSLSASHAETISKWAVEWGLQNETYGFRHHKQLRCLVKARALMHAREKVIPADMNDLFSWRKFFSSNEPAVL